MKFKVIDTRTGEDVTNQEDWYIDIEGDLNCLITGDTWEDPDYRMDSASDFYKVEYYDDKPVINNF